MGSTKRQLQVDIWLANHPFYTNSQVLIDSEGRVEKFMKKYKFGWFANQISTCNSRFVDPIKQSGFPSHKTGIFSNQVGCISDFGI